MLCFLYLDFIILCVIIMCKMKEKNRFCFIINLNSKFEF